MSKRKVRGRDKYLVQQKGCMVEEDTWESRENLKNAIELIEEFEREYSREEENKVRQQEAEEDREMFSRELSRRYTTKLLYGQSNKKYDKKYWKQIEKNWRQWKKNPFSKYSRNLFLKRMEKKKNEYKGRMVEE